MILSIALGTSAFSALGTGGRDCSTCTPMSRDVRPENACLPVIIS